MSIQTPSAVTVDVKSAWYSKVNWVAGIGAAIGIINEAAPMMPPKYQHFATIAVFALTAISTIYLKTFQTTTVTPSSAAKVQ